MSTATAAPPADPTARTGPRARASMSLREVLARVRTALTIGELEQALSLVQHGLEARPDSPELFNILGNIQLRRGEHGHAKRALARAIKLRHDYADAFNNMGVVHKETGDLDKAIQFFGYALNFAPQSADVRYNLGNAYKQLGQWGKAIAQYNVAAELDPQRPAIYNNLGLVHEQLGQLDEAIRAYRRGLQIDENQPHILYNLAVIFRAQGNLTDARTELQRATRLKPGWVDALNNLGIVQQELGEYEAAVKTFKEALRIAPDDIQTHNNLGVVYAEMGRSQEAAEHYRGAIQQDPTYAKASANLGAVYEREGRLPDALAEYERFSTEQPDDLDGRLRLGQSLAKLDRTDEAIAQFDHVVRHDASHQRALHALGLAQQRSGDFASAEDSFARLLQLAPRNPGYHLDRALLKRDTGDLRGAETDLNAFLQEHPGDVRARSMLGDLSARQGLHTQAAQIFRELAREQPDSVELHAKLAKELRATGDTDEARRALEQVINAQGTDRQHAGDDLIDLESLEASLADYESIMAEYEQQSAEQWDRNRRLLTDEAQRPDQDVSDGEDSLLTDALVAVAEDDEAETIMAIGGAEPVFALNEEEETLVLREVDEDPPEPEPGEELDDASLSNSLLRGQQVYADREPIPARGPAPPISPALPFEQPAPAPAPATGPAAPPPAPASESAPGAGGAAAGGPPAGLAEPPPIQPSGAGSTPGAPAPAPAPEALPELGSADDESSGDGGGGLFSAALEKSEREQRRMIGDLAAELANIKQLLQAQRNSPVYPPLPAAPQPLVMPAAPPLMPQPPSAPAAARAGNGSVSNGADAGVDTAAPSPVPGEHDAVVDEHEELADPAAEAQPAEDEQDPPQLTLVEQDEELYGDDEDDDATDLVDPTDLTGTDAPDARDLAADDDADAETGEPFRDPREMIKAARRKLDEMDDEQAQRAAEALRELTGAAPQAEPESAGESESEASAAPAGYAAADAEGHGDAGDAAAVVEGHRDTGALPADAGATGVAGGAAADAEGWTDEVIADDTLTPPPGGPDSGQEAPQGEAPAGATPAPAGEGAEDGWIEADLPPAPEAAATDAARQETPPAAPAAAAAADGDGERPQPSADAGPQSERPLAAAADAEPRARLLDYLSGLTEYLPAQRRSEFNASGTRLKLAYLQARLAGRTGLRERAALRAEPAAGHTSAPTKAPVATPARPVTRTAVADAFSYLQQLAQHHPREEVAQTLSRRAGELARRLAPGRQRP